MPRAELALSLFLECTCDFGFRLWFAGSFWLGGLLAGRLQFRLETVRLLFFSENLPDTFKALGSPS